MLTPFQLTLALIGVVVILGVCIPVWIRKSRVDKNELEYQRPTQNSIKNFDLDVNLHTDAESLNQLKLPIQEENEIQLNLFQNTSVENDTVPNEIDNSDMKGKVFKLFIKPKSAGVFSGEEIRRILENLEMTVEELPVFSKKISTEQHKIFEVNIADMYEPGVIDLNTIDQSNLRGLVIFTTLNLTDNPEALFTFFNFSYEVSSTLSGTLFLGEYVFSQSEFDLFESVALKE